MTLILSPYNCQYRNSINFGGIKFKFYKKQHGTVVKLRLVYFYTCSFLPPEGAHKPENKKHVKLEYLTSLSSAMQMFVLRFITKCQLKTFYLIRVYRSLTKGKNNYNWPLLMPFLVGSTVTTLKNLFLSHLYSSKKYIFG